MGRFNMLSRGVATLPAPATITPSVSWNGTQESGFAGNVPKDPPREILKPGSGLLGMHYRAISGVHTVVFEADCKGGVLSATANWEGGQAVATSKTWSVETDVNGTPWAMYGYTFRLDMDAAVALNAAGRAHLYVTVTPANSAYQPVVLGPYVFYPRAADNLHDYSVVIAPSQPQVTDVSYQTPAAAMARAVALNKKFALLTVTESGQLDFEWVGRGFAESYTTITAAPGVTVRPWCSEGIAPTEPGFRIAYDGIEWRGSGIKWERDIARQYYFENGAALFWFNGIEVTTNDPKGRYVLIDKQPTGFPTRTNRPQTEMRCGATHCDAHDIYMGFNFFHLVMCNRIQRTCNDVVCSNNITYGNVISDCDPGSLRNGEVGLRAHLDSLSVTYVGPAASAGIAISGDPRGNRTVQLYEGGVSVLSLSVVYAKGGTNWTFPLLAAAISARSGWTATALSDERPAAAISYNTGSVNDPTSVINGGAPMACKSVTLTFTAIFDEHADIMQNAGQTYTGVIALKARQVGTAGNALALTSSSGGRITFSSSTLTGGNATAAAAADMTINSNPQVGDGIGLGGTTYTFVSGNPANYTQVRVEGTAELTSSNLMFAISKNASLYGTHSAHVSGKIFTRNTIWGLYNGVQFIHFNAWTIMARDWVIANNDVQQDPGAVGPNINMDSIHEHVLIKNNNAFVFNVNLGNVEAGESMVGSYQPDQYCEITGNVFRTMGWKETDNLPDLADRAMVVEDNAFSAGSGFPQGVRNVLLSGAAQTTIWTDPPTGANDNLGDFSYVPVTSSAILVATGPRAGRYIGRYGLAGVENAA